MWRRRKSTPSPETEEARRRLQQAEQDLAEAEADSDRVDRVHRRLAELRRRNRFGAMISDALRGT